MAPSPLIGLRRPVPLLAVKAAVDQAGHGARARGVCGPVVPVRLAQAVVAAHPSDALRDDAAFARAGPLIRVILRRLLLPTRLAPWRGVAPPWCSLSMPR